MDKHIFKMCQLYTMEYYLFVVTEWNLGICSSMDENGGHDTKGN